MTKAATIAAEGAAAGAVAGAEGAAKKIVNETAEKAGAAASNNATATKTPGFEGIFAITGLLAVGHIAKGRKQ